MRPVRQLITPDTLTRQVLFAVELVDPVTQELVCRGIEVAAAGLANEPIVSWSGRFVWLVEGNAWPSEITVTPFRVPYAAEQIAGPPRPADLARATAAERLMRVALRPTPAYDFDLGVTAVRGTLRESASAGAATVDDAAVTLAWFAVHPPGWNPAPPAGAAPLVRGARTDTRGEFAVFLATPPRNAEPDVASGMLKVRLQFTRDHPAQETRVTPDNFAFLPPEEAPRGRVPEGRLLRRDLTLAWTELEPV